MGERTRRRAAIWIAALVAPLLCLTSNSHAVYVHQGTQILFADDFESVAVHSEPINPQVGTWTATSTFTHVETPASDVDPRHPTSTYQSGAKYLRLPRYLSNPNDPNNPYPGLGASYMTGASFGNISSGTITAEFALYVPSTDTDFPVGIGLSNQASYVGSLAWIDVLPQTDAALTNKPVYFNNSVAAVLIPGVTFQTDKWQRWRIDYNILAGSNNDTWTVTVDGVTSSPVAATSANDGTHDGASTTLNTLVFRGDNNGATVFVDAVPEPGSIGLSLVFGLMLSRRRNERSAA